MQLRGLVSEVRQSVYAVLVEWERPPANVPKVQALGTAFSVSSDGIFVTADHVVNPQNNTPPGRAFGPNDKILLAQMQSDGCTASIVGPCQVLASSQPHDYAILKLGTVAGRIQKYLEIDLASRFEGDEVAICGYPLASTQTHPQNGAVTITMSIRVAAGIISSQQLQNNSKVLEVDFPILPGNSGGPLFHIRTGKVLGLAKATLSVGNGGGVTIGHLGQISDVRNLWSALKTHI